MFLFKRKGIYQLYYIDEAENTGKRISTKSRSKQDALKFLSNFKEEVKAKSKIKFITFKHSNPSILSL